MRKVNNLTDTIAAVSTPPGSGGISIVRMSGPEAAVVANRIFSRSVEAMASHTMAYGKICDPKDGSFVDQVLLCLMRAPKTYTREDVVEINCHGGHLVTQKVLSLCLENGARAAEAGEFTRRAFLNGRIDLTEAEAVMDVIDAKTEESRAAAAGQLSGRLRKKLYDLRDRVLDMTAAIEAAIDYPEMDEEEETYAQMEASASAILADLNLLLADFDRGKILREGLSVAILGKPNVGKSSLMNYLLDRERAIVTEIPGTTRDALEEYFNLGGIPVKLIDTAGIRTTGDVVEAMGVERSRAYAQSADLLLVVLDGSRPLDGEDMEILSLAEGRPHIVLVNKQDLPQAFDLPRNALPLSVHGEQGLQRLEGEIKERFFSGSAKMSAPMLTNVRHKQALDAAAAALERCLATIRSRMPEDFISFDLQDVLFHLGEVTGDTADDEIIDRIFTRFCLGK